MSRSGPATSARRALGALVAILAVGLGAAGQPPDPDAQGLGASERFEALMERVAYEQSRLGSLEATFVQRKESALLLEPEESRGTFSFVSPDRIRWDFAAPTEMVVLIDGEEMVTWYRELGRVERVSFGRQSGHVLKLMGAGSSLDSLRGYFSMRARFPADPAEPFELSLEPVSSRVRKRIESMTIRLDRKLFVPVFVRYVEAGGDATEIRFEDLRLDGEIPADRFELDLPEGVEEHRVDL